MNKRLRDKLLEVSEGHVTVWVSGAGTGHDYGAALASALLEMDALANIVSKRHPSYRLAMKRLAEGLGIPQERESP